MDGISRSRGWDKEIPYGVLPMEQLVLSDKWARNTCSKRYVINIAFKASGYICVLFRLWHTQCLFYSYS